MQYGKWDLWLNLFAEYKKVVCKFTSQDKYTELMMGMDGPAIEHGRYFTNRPYLPSSEKRKSERSTWEWGTDRSFHSHNNMRIICPKKGKRALQTCPFKYPKYI